MAAGTEEVRKEDEGQETLPEVHRRDKTDRAKVHHLRPVQSGADLRSVPLEGGKRWYARRQFTVGSGRRSAGVTTRWPATSGITGAGNEDETAGTDPGGSSRTWLTYR